MASAADGVGPYGTATSPTACQPEFMVAFRAARKNNWFPANAGLKVIGRVKVRVFPVAATELPVPATGHWLLEIMVLPGRRRIAGVI